VAVENIGEYAGEVGGALRRFVYELASIWLLIQLALIVLAGFLGALFAKLVKARLNLVELTMGWPLWLRLLVRLVADNLGTIFFILLLVVARAGVLAATPLPARSYLVGVAASLATAWVVIVLLTGVIHNQFVTRIVAIFAWTLAALSIVGLLAPTMAALDSVGIVLGGLRITPLLVIKTTILLLLTLWAANALSDFLERRVQTAADLTPSIQVLLGKVIRLLLLTFAVLIVLSTVGIDFSALAFFSGAIGVGVGFGLQKIVSNLVSGIILLADKSIKPGDVITVGDHFGWVTTMGARYTSVNTRDGREFLVPNEDFITQKVINWSYSSEDIQVELKFGVSYDSDPHKVRELALSACEDVPRVLQTPEPVCHLVAFGESSLDFCLRFWISDPANGITNVRGLVMLKLWDALKREGVEIPYPVRDLRMIPAKAPGKSAKRPQARKGR
jgi:small-conductance mechanosensitive channel